MAKAFSLFLLAACASCKDPLVGIPLCLIYETTAECNEGDRHFALTREQLKNWLAFTKDSAYTYASRKEECLQLGKLPPNRDTLHEMDACSIGGSCEDKDLVGYYAVDRSSWHKMRLFFEACGEKPILTSPIPVSSDDISSYPLPQ